MCGIFGVIQNETKNRTNISGLCRFMNQATHAGIFRGDDSTGYFQVKHDKDDVFVHKLPISGIYMAQDHLAQEIFRKTDEVPITVGHHRAATRGSVSRDNAHPFEHYDQDNYLVGVHNGFFNGWADKEDGIRFQVDSDWGLYQLFKHGDLDGLSRLNGAYALVWYRNDGKIRIACNAEREFHWAFIHKKNAMAFASEHGMLHWLLERNGLKIEDTIVFPQKGRMYTFDPNDVRAYKEDVIPEAPKALVSSRHAERALNSPVELRPGSGNGHGSFRTRPPTTQDDKEVADYVRMWEDRLAEQEEEKRAKALREFNSVFPGRGDDDPVHDESGDSSREPIVHTQDGYHISYDKNAVEERLLISYGETCEFFPNKSTIASRAVNTSELDGTLFVGNDEIPARMIGLDPSVFYNIDSHPNSGQVIEARVIGVAKIPPPKGSTDVKWIETAILSRPVKTWWANKPISDSIKEAVGEKKFRGPKGMVDLVEWLRLVKNGCDGCTKPIIVQEGLKDEIVWTGSDAGRSSPLCKTCAKHFTGTEFGATA